MRTFTLPIYVNNRYYFFEPITGALLYKNNSTDLIKNKNIKTPKLESILQLCDQPFLLQQSPVQKIKIKSNYLLVFYAKFLVRLCKISFILGRAVSNFGWPVFNSAGEAISFFRTLYPNEIQNNLCYPRSLFAASLSKKFKKNGVIFIGAFLPSKSMHAWIIEDGTQPDIRDSMWINFKPIAALYK